MIKVDNHIWQSWLELVYFRTPKLFTWNVCTDYIDHRKKCQHSLPLTLAVGQADLRGEASFPTEVGSPRADVNVCFGGEKEVVLLSPRYMLFWNPWKSPQDRICLHMTYNRDFPCGSVVKNLPADVGDIRDTGLIPVLGRSPGGGNGNPLQYSCLENLIDRGAWWATVHGSQKSPARWSDWSWHQTRLSPKSRAFPGHPRSDDPGSTDMH